MTILQHRRKAFRTPAGPPPWTTSYPSGLTLCMEADTAGAYADNDPVSSWADTSPNNIPLISTAAGNPIFRTSQINGKPAIYFDGSRALSSAANLPGSTWFSATNHTLFMILGSVLGGANPLAAWVAGADKEFDTFCPYINGNIYYRHGDSTGIFGAAPVGFSTGYHHIRMTRDGTTAASILVDGASVVSAPMSLALEEFPGVKFYLGAKYDTPISDGWVGYVAALLNYNRLLTPDEIALVEARNFAKYGV